MNTRMAYCATCDRQVRVMLKRGAAPGAEVSPDDVVCLDHGEICGVGTVCPIFDVPSEQMKEILEVHRSMEGEAQ